MEWGWKTPLLLRFSDSLPAAVTKFLGAPFDSLALGKAERDLTEKLSALRTSRIGVRFERVQSALFRAHPDTKDLRTGLVIPGRTEIDLLQRLRSLPGTVIHWEVAVKFYLCLDEEGSTDPDRYVGPSLRDTLGIKLRTIFDRQLRALEDDGVRAEYGPAFGLSPDDRVEALPKVHGVLFQPYRARGESRRPEPVAENGLRGAWLPFGRFADFVAATPSAGSKRLRWLRDRRGWIRDSRRIPALEADETELKDCLKSELFRGLQSHFAGGGEPIQATLLDADPGAPELRVFVVPDGWSDAAERELETLRATSRIKA